MSFNFLKQTPLILLSFILLSSCGSNEPQSYIQDEPSTMFEDLGPTLEKNLVFGLVEAGSRLDKSDLDSAELSQDLVNKAYAGIPEKLKPFYDGLEGIKIYKSNDLLKVDLQFDNQIVAKQVTKDKKLGHKIGLYFSRDFVISGTINITEIKDDFSGVKTLLQANNVFYKLADSMPTTGSHPWAGKKPVGLEDLTGLSAQTRVKGFSRKEFNNSPTTRMMIYENSIDSHIIFTNSNFNNNKDWFTKEHGNDPREDGWFTTEDAFRPYLTIGKPTKVTFLDMTAASNYSLDSNILLDIQKPLCIFYVRGFFLISFKFPKFL